VSGPQFFGYARKILQAVAWLAPLSVVMTVWATSARSQSEFPNLLQAQFRGCESAGWCKFWIESLDPMARSLYRVYPDGVRAPGSRRSFDQSAYSRRRLQGAGTAIQFPATRASVMEPVAVLLRHPDAHAH
jgi:hypothetical protein